MSKKIFISVASYQDPLLLETLCSAYENAENKDALVFGVCEQADSGIDIQSINFKNQIKYDNVDIKNIISRISNPSVFRTLSRDSIELDYFNNIIGVTEQEYYDYYNKNTKMFKLH